MKRFIETHLSLVLFAGAALGMVLPGAAALPAEVIPLAVAMAAFLACFRLQWSELHDLPWKAGALFCAARFVTLPLLLWALARQLAPSHADAVLLIALLPAGVSCPAFAALFGGSVALSLFVTLFSTLVSIAVIPLAFSAVGAPGVAASGGHLLVTLLLCLVLPMLVYIPLRRNAALNRLSAEYGRVATILLITLVILLVVARQRETILADPAALLVPFLGAALCFALFIAAGLLAPLRWPGDRIALLTCSAYNNAALGVSLAVLYFPPDVVLWTVAAEVGWAFLPLATQPLCRRLMASGSH